MAKLIFSVLLAVLTFASASARAKDTLASLNTEFTDTNTQIERFENEVATDPAFAALINKINEALIDVNAELQPTDKMQQLQAQIIALKKKSAYTRFRIYNQIFDPLWTKRNEYNGNQLRSVINLIIQNMVPIAAIDDNTSYLVLNQSNLRPMQLFAVGGQAERNGNKICMTSGKKLTEGKELIIFSPATDPGNLCLGFDRTILSLLKTNPDLLDQETLRTSLSFEEIMGVISSYRDDIQKLEGQLEVEKFKTYQAFVKQSNAFVLKNKSELNKFSPSPMSRWIYYSRQKERVRSLPDLILEAEKTAEVDSNLKTYCSGKGITDEACQNWISQWLQQLKDGPWTKMR